MKTWFVLVVGIIGVIFGAIGIFRVAQQDDTFWQSREATIKAAR